MSRPVDYVWCSEMSIDPWILSKTAGGNVRCGFMRHFILCGYIHANILHDTLCSPHKHPINSMKIIFWQQKAQQGNTRIIYWTFWLLMQVMTSLSVIAMVLWWKQKRLFCNQRRRLQGSLVGCRWHRLMTWDIAICIACLAMLSWTVLRGHIQAPVAVVQTDLCKSP